MKKVFILTGEPSGDKLASSVISKLKMLNSDIQYLSVGGTHLNSLGIKTLSQCKFIGLKGIVLKSKQNVFLDQKKCISFANKNKIFINIK